MNKHSLMVTVLSVLILWATGLGSLTAQEHGTGRTAETSTTVPPLTEFHTVIFKIWHTAWPNKDYTMLMVLVPEIEKGVAAIAKAELPGILREKRAAWIAGVEKLQAVVKEYHAAADAKLQQPLLDAAEKLHSQYEALVRILRPPLKELDDFHAVLYVLYHYYMPQDSLVQVRVSVGQLQQKMAQLNNAMLPSRFKERETAFSAARAQLDQAVTKLASAMNSNNSKNIKTAVEEMHARYEALEKILE
jgi:hypothetical protein